MVRISTIFIAFCMALIAASVGAVLYFRFAFRLTDSVLAAVGVLAALWLYNAIVGRKHDRAEVSDQVSSIARGSSDLARQLAEFGRRLEIMESKVEAVLDRAAATAQPLITEIEELSRLVRQLAESVALHEVELGQLRENKRGASPANADTFLAAVDAAANKDQASGPATPAPANASNIAAFRGLDRDGIVAMVRSAIEANKIDLYLQPIVTLPQRKVRYYEAMSRLNAGNGEVITAADFLPYAEAGALLPKLDNLSVLRCVQLVRRLLLKNRDVGLFCNLAAATLADAAFPQLLEFIEANRAIAPSLVFEFAQSAVRAMGPIEHESLAALAQRGFRFSMDNLADLRLEPRELTGRGFRFIKVPATLLLSRSGAGVSNIHSADFSDLLGRFGIDLIAERIESESTVVDLLDYDVRFGQGFLFSPPRPVRAEALQGIAGEAAKTESAKMEASAAAQSGAAQLARTGSARGQ